MVGEPLSSDIWKRQGLLEIARKQFVDSEIQSRMMDSSREVTSGAGTPSGLMAK